MKNINKNKPSNKQMQDKKVGRKMGEIHP